MNNIELYNGDCLEVMKNIPDNSVDMVLCDLPYGYIESKWDVQIPMEKLWEFYKKVLKDGGSVLRRRVRSNIRITIFKLSRKIQYIDNI